MRSQPKLRNDKYITILLFFFLRVEHKKKDHQYFTESFEKASRLHGKRISTVENLYIGDHFDKREKSSETRSEGKLNLTFMSRSISYKYKSNYR